MEREKVRSLEKMPMKNKLAYCQLLTMMVKEKQPINELKMMELYRLMSNIRIPASKRQEVLTFLFQGHEEIEVMCNTMLEDVNQQEKNILRFSLIKDLMIISGADSSATPREKIILKEIEALLEITKEQKNFLLEEYQKDRTFYLEEKKEKFNDQLQKETVAHAFALGIPLSIVYFNGCYWGMGTLGVLSGLEDVGFKKRTKRYSAAVGLGVTIIAALGTYHLVKGIWSYKKKNHLELKDLIKEEMLLIHQRAIRYLEKDIEGYIDLQQEEVRELLIRTLTHMRKTRPRII